MGAARRGMGVNRQTHSRHRITGKGPVGVGWGAGQDLTVLNRFSKKFSRFAVFLFFFLSFFFFSVFFF